MAKQRALPNLLSNWDSIAPQLRQSERIALFLDFDGTLVPIAPRPEQVRLNPSTRRTLARLARRPRVNVTIISGRRRCELLEHIGVRNVLYLGLYGWERDGGPELSRAAYLALRRANQMLHEKLAAFPGVWVEDKQSSLSIHLAAARPAVKLRARRQVPGLLRRFRGALRLLVNIRDLEVVPYCVPDKGAALRQSLAGEFSNAFPLYFGDDYSDEPAFVAVRHGLPVIVGNRTPTRARFRLRGPEEVADALSRLEKGIA
jgi:trehalose 6-phosphate phosphatase